LSWKLRLLLVTGFAFSLTRSLYGLAEWTVMVYLDGDNNLESFAVNDFLEMSQVGSTSAINIVVQLDRISGHDSRYDNWTETHRFYVTQGMVPSRANAISNWGDGKGGREVNMGDPQTLVDFVTWSMSRYPARRYALILWDHGSGWKEMENTLTELRSNLHYVSSPEEKRKIREKIKELEGKLSRWKIEKSICTDDSSGYDSLTLQELRWALEEIPGTMDIIGFDACLMGMIEVAYEIKNYSFVMVASQADENGDGWPYDTILQSLKNSPEMSAEEFAFVMVEKYGQEYSLSQSATLSAVRLPYIFDLRVTLDNLVANLLGKNQDWLAVHIALQTTRRFDDTDYKDLKGFLGGVVSGTWNEELKDLAEAVITEFDNVLIASSGPPGANGLSIYLPDFGRSISSQYNPDVVLFAESSWAEFLVAFQQADPFPELKVYWQENFDEGLPESWTVVDGYSDGKTWTDSNPGKRVISNLTSPFMIVDSDWAGRVNMDESLVSPSFSLPSRPCYLVFDHYFHFYELGNQEKGELDISAGNGNWENLISFTGSDTSGLVIINLSAYAGQSKVQFRWHYYQANYDWYWAIDNIRILVLAVGQRKGDINRDDEIDIRDVILCLRMVTGLMPVDQEKADLDENGEVDIQDVILILHKVLQSTV